MYRYLPKQYVDAFFKTGALRLSSFQQFSQHVDEQRVDSKEGKTFLIHRTSDGGGQTLTMEVDYGHDAYVLCGSMAPSKELLKAFGCDSAIVITDTKWFGREVSKKVPGFRMGVEGPCSYQFRRIIEKDLGYLDFGPVGPDGKISQINTSALAHAYGQLSAADAYFLKREVHRYQVEYRFIWLTNDPIQPALDIVVPDARRYCVPWEDQGDVVAY